MANDNEFLNLEQSDNSDSSEKLILGKFKEQSELEKAYTELETKLTSSGQELGELKRVVGELQTRVVTQQTVVPQEEEEEDEDQEYFKSPAKAVRKLIEQALEPIATATFVQQKDSLRSDPLFVKYEAEIDTIVNQIPSLKKQPGVVGQLFKMVKGMHYDPAEEEKRIRGLIKDEQDGKVAGSLEGGSSGGIQKVGKQADLTSDEKRIAVRFNPGIPADEAYKKYAEKKAKYGGGA